MTYNVIVPNAALYSICFAVQNKQTRGSMTGLQAPLSNEQSGSDFRD